jgi:dihydropteroate synthase
MSAPAGVRARILKSLSENQAIAEMIARGADRQAIAVLQEKFGWLAVVIAGLSLVEAGALRKQAQAAGLQALLCRTLERRSGAEAADIIVAGTRELLRQFAREQVQVGAALLAILDNTQPPKRIWQCGTQQLALGGKTLIMGILNATPDSFSGDGLGSDVEAGLERAAQMVADGADILDIGGESTRPGAEAVPAEEELARVVPLIKRIAAELEVAISIDTTKAAVAREALAQGACIVNDVTGLRGDTEMAQVAAQANAGVVIMHIKGTPRDMQQDPRYNDLMGEITAYLAEGIVLAKTAGIADEQIMVDPGIGFSKTMAHNLEILRRLGELRGLGYPILVGTSRKATIGKLLGTEAQDRKEGTAATVALAIAAGAEVVRVHDVKEMARVAKVADAIVRVKREEPAEEEIVKWGE